LMRSYKKQEKHHRLYGVMSQKAALRASSSRFQLIAEITKKEPISLLNLESRQILKTNLEHLSMYQLYGLFH
jgi:hypothetical protein